MPELLDHLGDWLFQQDDDVIRVLTVPLGLCTLAMSALAYYLHKLGSSASSRSHDGRHFRSLACALRKPWFVVAVIAIAMLIAVPSMAFAYAAWFSWQDHFDAKDWGYAQRRLNETLRFVPIVLTVACLYILCVLPRAIARAKDLCKNSD